MAITGVTNPLLNNLATIARPAAPNTGRPGAAGTGAVGTGAVGTGAVGAGAARPAATPALRPQQSLAAPSNALPTEPPAGTDPELWSVLTTEERAFFAKAAATGPITYGRVAARLNATSMATQAAPAVRGVRLDVRA